MKKFSIAREGLPYILLLLLLAVAFYPWRPYLSTVPFSLALFCAFFFRNPYRCIPNTEGAIVSPADGVVLDIAETYEDNYLHDEAIKVSIFLSLFNVHINRIPFNGTVEYISRVSGRFVPAFHRSASQVNSRNLVGIRTDWGKLLVVQITGLIARRIVCRAKVGSSYRTGEVFGLIKFGSCTEIYLPRNVVLSVKLGDKVKGGETVIGRINDGVYS
ncbi:MAG: phosphatidylserine decarboxylase family protein [Syntrophomonadaceae bacterium]|nr:phosphatidylserine decarboxylase family protein [Syntrophomonadaceae bacterium]